MTITGRWGEDDWGAAPWGGFSTPTPTPTNKLIVLNTYIWAADLIELEVSPGAKNDGILQDPSSYEVVVESGDGVDVVVREIHSGPSPATSRIFLVVTPPTAGTIYNVNIVGGLTTVDGAGVEPTTYGWFKSRLTKIDSLLSTRQTVYSLKTTSVYRAVLSAIGREDDRIGGSQKDER